MHPHNRLATERGTEHLGALGHPEPFEGIPGRPRKGEELVGLTLVVRNVVEESTEFCAGDPRGRVGYGLNKILKVELGGYPDGDLVQSLGFFARLALSLQESHSFLVRPLSVRHIA